jgi:hypothetical protein
MDDFMDKQEQAMARMQTALLSLSTSQANSKTMLLQEINTKLHAQESATNARLDRLLKHPKRNLMSKPKRFRNMKPPARNYLRLQPNLPTPRIS